MNKQISILEGGLAIDDRGMVSFVNEFRFTEVKRCYLVENFSKDTIRAFHGHLKEAKYVYVVSGSIILALVKMDNKTHPDRSNKVERFILSARKPQIVFIPAGYANGFKALEDHSKIMFFSTCALEESLHDDYRFHHNYWGEDVWKVENR